MLNPTGPWGLSPSWFMLFYNIVLVGLWTLLGLARRGVGRAVPPTPLPTLDLMELAYLHGGERRVGETEVARLLSQRKLRIHKRGYVVAAGQGSHLSGAILDAAREPQSVLNLTTQAADSPEMSHEIAPVLDRLRAKGLIARARERTRRRRVPPALLAAWSVVGVVGLVWWFAGGQPRQRPSEGALFLLLLFELWPVIGSSVIASKPTCAFSTPAGRGIVTALRRANGDRGDVHDGQVLARYDRLLRGPTGTVAVSGLHAFPDPEVRKALSEPPDQRAGHSGGA